MKPDPAGATSSQISLREYMEAKVDSLTSEFRTYQKTMEVSLKLAAEGIEGRLKLLNELRAEVLSDRANYVTRDKYEAEMVGRNLRIEAIDKWIAAASGTETEIATSQARIKALEDWKNKLLGLGVMIALFSGLVGALVMRLFSGVFGK
jgi:hypothetical protein